MINEELVSEPIKPLKPFETASLESGEPGLPMRFSWRQKHYSVKRVLHRWCQTGECLSGGNERYVRRHYYHIETTDGDEMTLYFERRPHNRTPAGLRWWLYTITHKETASESSS
jgi:hypothetical protein